MNDKAVVIILTLLTSLVILAGGPTRADEHPEPALLLLELDPVHLTTASRAPDRDPFNWPDSQRLLLLRKAAEEQDLFTGFTLQALIWNATTPQAVINGKLATIGTMVAGAQVTNISRTQVILRKNNREHVMRFNTPAIDFGTTSDSKENSDDTM